MIKLIKISVTVFMITLILSSCQSESKKDINELIKTLNSSYSYKFNINDFFAEENENIIYHYMTDKNSLLSLYSNKRGEIIQCTLSSFDQKNENNYKLITDIGNIMTEESKKTFETMLKNALETGKYSQNGWTVIFITNDLGATYIINQTTDNLNHNSLPTMKNHYQD